MVEYVVITGVRAYESELENHGNITAFTIFWQKDDGQFGHIDIKQSIFRDGSKQIFIDSEMMSREFVKDVLMKLVDIGNIKDEVE